MKLYSIDTTEVYPVLAKYPNVIAQRLGTLWCELALTDEQYAEIKGDTSLNTKTLRLY